MIRLFAAVLAASALTLTALPAHAAEVGGKSKVVAPVIQATNGSQPYRLTRFEGRRFRDRDFDHDFDARPRARYFYRPYPQPYSYYHAPYSYQNGYPYYGYPYYAYPYYGYGYYGTPRFGYYNYGYGNGAVHVGPLFFRW